MGYYRVVVGVLVLAAAAFASVGDNTIDGGDRVVLVAPVLAPPRDSRTHSTDRARQFPILVLLAQQYPIQQVREPEPKSLGRNPQPIYVQKLEDQVMPDAVTTVNRQKRHLKKGGWGRRGGCKSCGWGRGGNFSGYRKPSKVVVVYLVQGGGYGGYGGNQGGCNTCGGGGGGGSSQSWSQSSAQSSSGSSSSGYGRK